MKSQSSLEKSYRPITYPLKQLLITLKPEYPIKKEIKEENPINRKDYYKTAHGINLEETYQYEPSAQLTIESSFFIPEYNESFFDETISQQPFLSKEEEEELKFQQYLEQYVKPLLRAFIEDLIRTTEKNVDDRFGVYFNPEKEKFAIGNLKLEFDGPHLLLSEEKLRYIDILRRNEAHNQRDATKV